jgi:MFS family permease
MIIPPTTLVAPDPTGDNVASSAEFAVHQQRLLLRTMPIASFGISVLWGSIGSIFLAVQLQTLSPGDKVGSLALAIGIGAFGTMLAGPIAGTLSDRTRTRIGGRAPWMLGGLVVTIAAMAFMAFATSAVGLIVAYTVVMIASNFVGSPLIAHIPDRVPPERRGIFSSLSGLGTIIGAIVGQTVAAVFSGTIPFGYLVVAAVFTIAVSVFLIVNARQSNSGVPREHYALIDVLRTFWVNPIRNPDFFWAFVGRMLIVTGYYLVSALVLYILQDYIGLGEEAVLQVPVVGGCVLVGIVISTIISGPLSDKVGRRKVFIFIASGLMAVSILIPFVWPTFTAFLVFAFISGFGFGAYNAVDYALITQVLPSSAHAGRDLGIINISGNLPQTFGAAAAGLIVTAFGYGALFPIAALIVLVGAVAIVPIRSVR